MQLRLIPSQAQNVFESLDDTAVVHADQAPAAAAPIMKKKWNHFESKWLTLNFGVAVLKHVLLTALFAVRTRLLVRPHSSSSALHLAPAAKLPHA